MEAADILEFEKVHIWNVTNGSRLVTYAMSGEANTGIICINGAAAHLVMAGDLVIIATFVNLSDPDAKRFRPIVVIVDAENKIKDSHGVEIAGPARPPVVK